MEQKFIMTLATSNETYNTVLCNVYYKRNKPPQCRDFDVGYGSCNVNRECRIECNSSNCTIGDVCINQQLVLQCTKICRKELEPHCGYGLKILEPAFAGDLIMEYTGQVINRTTTTKRREEPYDNYYIM